MLEIKELFPTIAILRIHVIQWRYLGLVIVIFLDFAFEGYSISVGRMLSQDEIDDNIPNLVLSYEEYYHFQTEQKLSLGDIVTIN